MHDGRVAVEVHMAGRRVTVNDVRDGHVVLDLECLNRSYLLRPDVVGGWASGLDHPAVGPQSRSGVGQPC